MRSCNACIHVHVCHNCSSDVRALCIRDCEDPTQEYFGTPLCHECQSDTFSDEEVPASYVFHPAEVFRIVGNIDGTLIDCRQKRVLVRSHVRLVH